MDEDRRRLRIAAWTALGVHFVAGVALALVLRHGLETNADLADRLAFIVRRRSLWTAAWATWNVAAASILYLFYALWKAHGGAACRLAVAVSAAGAAADLTAEAIEMFVLPPLAARGLVDPAAAVVFLKTHRQAVLLTGGLANGLYTASTWLVVLSTWSRYRALTRAAGVGVGLAGAALSAAAVMGSVSGLMWTNAVLLPCLVMWQAGIARESALGGAPGIS